MIGFKPRISGVESNRLTNCFTPLPYFRLVLMYVKYFQAIWFDLAICEVSSTILIRCHITTQSYNCLAWLACVVIGCYIFNQLGSSNSS